MNPHVYVTNTAISTESTLINNQPANSFSWSLCCVVLLLFTMCTDVQAEPQALWSSSGHADASAEAFTHWNDEGSIPENCAACHAESGFLDFIAADGSNPMRVDKAHATGSVVGCNVCHNDQLKALSVVPFPSGVEVAVTDTASATCLVCHQGRASSVSVNEILHNLPADEINPELGFINIHYKAAAATLYGNEVQGGYQYQGKTYLGKFVHVPDLSSCAGCHNPHSLEVATSDCTGCHAQASSALAEIRTSTQDFDGDGDVTEGITMEIQALHESLGAALVVYAAQTLDSPVIYSPTRYPYFFHDKNGNVKADDDELTYPNRYMTWTPRLLRAAYNYQYVAKDTGAYAHNPKYALQLLYDSIESLSEFTGIDMTKFVRP